jgi:hypothetical protein
MTREDNDLTLQRLVRLPVLEPNPARSERVRSRCHAALAQRQRQRERAIASRRVTARVLESGLMYALSVGYLYAMIHDVFLVYMRR